MATTVSGIELVRLADSIAEVAHEGQLYADGPFIEHPREVSFLAKEFGYPHEVQATALLHDVLEDTTVTEHELRYRGIPTVVVSSVVSLTSFPGDRDKIAKALSNPISHVVKFFDASVNFAVTEDEPARRGVERGLADLRRYARYLGQLSTDLPKPFEITVYLNNFR